jgi:hypothetical protein
VTMRVLLLKRIGDYGIKRLARRDAVRERR